METRFAWRKNVVTSPRNNHVLRFIYSGTAVNKDTYHFKIASTTSMPIPQLPLELVTTILNHLRPAALWRAAHVSRSFYFAAKFAGLVILRAVFLSHNFRHQLRVFKEITRHLLEQDSPVKLSLIVDLHPQSSNREPRSQQIALVLAALSDALPLLVKLQVVVPHDVTGRVYDALAFPAVRLRGVRIVQQAGRECIPIPSTLFGGVAPMLQVVILEGAAVPLSGDFIPAFECAVHVWLITTTRAPLIAPGSSFPAVRRLTIAIRRASHGSPALNTRIDLAGLALQHLCIQDSTGGAVQVLSDAQARRFHAAAINYTYCDHPDYHEALWPPGNPELDADIRQRTSRSPLLRVYTRGRVWKKSLSALPRQGPLTAPALNALESLPQLQRRLVSLLLNGWHVPLLIQTPLFLDALRELYVDFTAYRIWNPNRPAFDDISVVPPEECRCRCPALGESITLFATVTRAASRRVIVRHAALASLARALGQMDRSSDARASLILAGVKLDIPAEDGSISKAEILKYYSSLRESESVVTVEALIQHIRHSNDRE